MRTVTLAAIMGVTLGGPAQAQLVLSVPAGGNASNPAERTEAQAQEPAPSQIQDQAQPKIVAPSPEASRFQFNKVNGGFVRFDSQTGKMAYCSPHTVGWNCQAVAEDRSALEQEITQLNDRSPLCASKCDDLREKSAPTPPQPVPPPPVAIHAGQER